MSTPSEEMASVRFLEEAYANVWPSFEQVLYDGWILRYTGGGYDIETNSVWPLYEGDIPVESKITFCERQYERRGMKCAFRTTGLPNHDSIEELLTERGYVRRDPGFVMVCASMEVPDVSVTELELEEWVETAYRLSPVEDPGKIEWELQVLKRLSLPGRFAVVMRDGKACAYGRSVLQGEMLNIEDLWTLPEWRNRGIGTELIQGLKGLGLSDGAKAAFITVGEENTDARRLYERLGFEMRYRSVYLVSED